MSGVPYFNRRPDTPEPARKLSFEALHPPSMFHSFPGGDRGPANRWESQPMYSPGWNLFDNRGVVAGESFAPTNYGERWQAEGRRRAIGDAALVGLSHIRIWVRRSRTAVSRLVHHLLVAPRGGRDVVAQRPAQRAGRFQVWQLHLRPFGRAQRSVLRRRRSGWEAPPPPPP